MAKYIWINPVAIKMYGDKLQAIEDGLIRNGYEIVSCDSQMDYVRNQYIEYGITVDETVLDCRCPETIKLLEKNNLLEGYKIPDIEPILVRTSRVLYENHVKNEDDLLIITTPCSELRDFAQDRLKGNKGIKFLTWKEFIEDEGMKSLGKIDKSPIPLGFFENYFDKVLELSDEKRILADFKILKEAKGKKYNIIEMLYCDGGCNSGNGL